MCEANKICTCCGSTKPLKLEVGRTYVNGIGQKVKIVYHSDGKTTYPWIGVIQKDGWEDTIRYTSTGKANWLDNRTTDIVKEYREPRVTKVDIILVGNKEFPDRRETWVRDCGINLGKSSVFYEISRKTVEFVED